MRFPYFWIRFIPLLGLIVFNSIIVINTDPVNLSLILGISCFFGIAFFFSRWLEGRRLRRFEKQFNDKLDLVEYYLRKQKI